MFKKNKYLAKMILYFLFLIICGAIEISCIRLFKSSPIDALKGCLIFLVGIVVSYFSCKGINNSPISNNTIIIIAVLCFAIPVFAGLMSMFSGNSSRNYSSSNNSATCRVCHRVFTDSNNKHSIAQTNMCENCYNNYQWGQAATGNK